MGPSLIVSRPQREETAEEVRLRRGSPTEALRRIRTRYNLTEEIMNTREIFYNACKFYHGEEKAKQSAHVDYASFQIDDVLPDYMWRCSDPDVYYPEMRAY